MALDIVKGLNTRWFVYITSSHYTPRHTSISYKESCQQDAAVYSEHNKRQCDDTAVYISDNATINWATTIQSHLHSNLYRWSSVVETYAGLLCRDETSLHKRDELILPKRVPRIEVPYGRTFLLSTPLSIP